MYLKIKQLLENQPEFVGKIISHIPYSLRLGKEYNISRRRINYYTTINQEDLKKRIFDNIKSIVTYSYKNVKFYKEYYSDKNFSPSNLKTFDDIKMIPIINKEVLKNYDLNDRSNPKNSKMLINTGGTSGEPLSFYIDKDAFAREWAHMHHIWSELNYIIKDLKITFRGRNLKDDVIKYNAVHNEYLVNSYILNEIIYNELLQLSRKKDFKYIHGYPSLVYDFALFCKDGDQKLIRELHRSLQGIFLGSEYPAPQYRKLIEEIFQVPTLSWYGHSEFAVLAYEKYKQYEYVPMYSYGYPEAVKDSSGNYRLIGTSYFNTASPFIRYETGDLVLPEFKDPGLLKNFRIGRGRIGEFVEDKNGQNISLTSLIFGRHHKAFDLVRFIQVRQIKAGEIELRLATDISKSVNWEDYFDFSSVDIDVCFKQTVKPFRTKSGKTPLLVKR